jgi:hypothetical protein
MAMETYSAILQELGKHRLALPLLERLTSSHRGSNREDELRTAAKRSSYAWTLLECGEAGKAKPIIESVITTRNKHLPSGHWLIANAENILGGCLTELGQYEAATAKLTNSATILLDSKEANRNRAVIAVHRVVRNYEKRGMAAEAANWRAKLPQSKK